MSRPGRSKERKKDVDRSASPSISESFGELRVRQQSNERTNSPASTGPFGSDVARAGSGDRHKTQSPDRRLNEDLSRDLSRGARERSPATENPIRGRHGGPLQAPGGQYQHIPHPTNPNWRNFPVELKVMSFRRLQTTEIHQFYRQDSFYKQFIDTNELAIADPIMARETERIKESYNFKGKSFIDALQWWTCQKGIILNNDWLWRNALTFVHRYMDSHDDTSTAVAFVLSSYTWKLLRLYVFKHTSPEILNNIPWGYDVVYGNMQLSEFCNDEAAFCNFLGQPGLLPPYANNQSADNYVSRVKTDPDLFGGVTGRQYATVEGRFRLTALGMETTGGPVQDYLVKEHHVTQSSDLVESFLYDELNLERLPVGFAYCVDSSEHLYSVDEVVQRYHHDKKAVRPLEKAGVLEKIKVM